MAPQMNYAGLAAKCWPPLTTCGDNLRWTYELWGVSLWFRQPGMEKLKRHKWSSVIGPVVYARDYDADLWSKQCSSRTDGENRVNFQHHLGRGKQWRRQWELAELQTHVVDPYVVTRKPNHHPLGYPRSGSDAEWMRIPRLTLQK